MKFEDAVEEKCNHCHGTGKCPRYKSETEKSCIFCHGKEKCSFCNGTGKIKKNKESPDEIIMNRMKEYIKK